MIRNKFIFVILLLIGLASSGVGLAQGLDMEFKQAPLGDVFQILGEIAGHNVLIDPSVEGTVSFYLKDLSVKEALDLIARTTGYGYEIVNNTLVVASNQRLQMGFASAEFVFVSLNNVSVDAANQLVSVVVPTVKSYSDTKHNLIVLTGPKEEVNHAKTLLEQYDSISQGFWPLNQGDQKSFNENATLRAYRIPINYGNGEGIVRYVQRLFPARDLKWDSQLELITAVTTEEEWEEILEIITERDLPNFIIKGIIADDLKTLVLVEFNGTTSLVQQGKTLVGWTLTDVVDKDVIFSKDERNFVVTMGR